MNKYAGFIVARLVDVIGTLGEITEQEAWLDYRQYSYTSKDVTSLLAVIVDYPSYMASDDGANSWKPVHAWRALGQLGLPRAIEPLIVQFDLLHEDDWAFIELPQVLAMLGEQALPPLAAYLLEVGHDEFAKVMALEAMVLLQQDNAELKVNVAASIKAYLSSPDVEQTSFNALLISEIIDLDLRDLEPLVVELFKQNGVDSDVCGDLAFVQKSFAELAAKAAEAQANAKQVEAVAEVEAPEETEEEGNEPLKRPKNPDDVIGLLDYYLDHYATEDSILSCSELDGFCHAIACSPNLIEPTVWLPLIWGEACIAPEWEAQYEAKEFPDLVFSIYSHALENLARGSAEPLFYEPDEEGKSYEIANEWCAGFLRGGSLWDEIDVEDVELVDKPIALVKLFATEEGFAVLDAMTAAEVAAKQDEVLDGVNTIYKHFYALRNKPIQREEPKVGRNDPCPCGSGKKFKKCCATK